MIKIYIFFISLLIKFQLFYVFGEKKFFFGGGSCPRPPPPTKAGKKFLGGGDRAPPQASLRTAYAYHMNKLFLLCLNALLYEWCHLKLNSQYVVWILKLIDQVPEPIDSIIPVVIICRRVYHASVVFVILRRVYPLHQKR